MSPPYLLYWCYLNHICARFDLFTLLFLGRDHVRTRGRSRVHRTCSLRTLFVFCQIVIAHVPLHFQFIRLILLDELQTVFPFHRRAILQFVDQF